MQSKCDDESFINNLSLTRIFFIFSLVFIVVALFKLFVGCCYAPECRLIFKRRRRRRREFQFLTNLHFPNECCCFAKRGEKKKITNKLLALIWLSNGPTLFSLNSFITAQFLIDIDFFFLFFNKKKNRTKKCIEIFHLNGWYAP